MEIIVLIAVIALILIMWVIVKPGDVEEDSVNPPTQKSESVAVEVQDDARSQRNR